MKCWCTSTLCMSIFRSWAIIRSNFTLKVTQSTENRLKSALPIFSPNKWPRFSAELKFCNLIALPWFQHINLRPFLFNYILMRVTCALLTSKLCRNHSKTQVFFKAREKIVKIFLFTNFFQVSEGSSKSSWGNVESGRVVSVEMRSGGGEFHGM